MGKPIKTLNTITCSIIYATKNRPACANPKIWNQQLWIHKLNLICISKNESILDSKNKWHFFFKTLNQVSRNRSACFTCTYTTCLNYYCKEKKQKNQLAVKCTTRRSKLLKFIFRKILVKNGNYWSFRLDFGNVNAQFRRNIPGATRRSLIQTEFHSRN